MSDFSCDCGCEDIGRTPMADLTFYPEESTAKPAGVELGYLILRHGEETDAEVVNVALLHDGAGNATGQIDQSTWRRAQIRDGQ